MLGTRLLLTGETSSNWKCILIILQGAALRAAIFVFLARVIFPCLILVFLRVESFGVFSLRQRETEAFSTACPSKEGFLRRLSGGDHPVPPTPWLESPQQGAPCFLIHLLLCTMPRLCQDKDEKGHSAQTGETYSYNVNMRKWGGPKRVAGGGFPRGI